MKKARRRPTNESSPQSTSGVPPPLTRHLSERQLRERTRKLLAVGVLTVFGTMAVGPYALLICRLLTLEQVKELMVIQFGPVTTMAATALGFYFGRRNGGRE
jgi:hypothetical protein